MFIELTTIEFKPSLYGNSIKENISKINLSGKDEISQITIKESEAYNCTYTELVLKDGRLFCVKETSEEIFEKIDEVIK